MLIPGCFTKRPCLNFGFYPISIPCIQSEKAESVNSLPFAVYFHMGAYFCMGAYKRNVVVVIKMGAYIHGVLILCGCLLSRFYGIVGSYIQQHITGTLSKSV